MTNYSVLPWIVLETVHADRCSAKVTLVYPQGCWTFSWFRSSWTGVAWWWRYFRRSPGGSRGVAMKIRWYI